MAEVAPPPLVALESVQRLWGFSSASAQRSAQLGRFYRIAAESLGCPFIDAGSLVTVSPLDGLHLDLGAHEKLGAAIAEQLRMMV